MTPREKKQRPATELQVQAIKNLAAKTGYTVEDVVWVLSGNSTQRASSLTTKEADQVIKRLKELVK